MSLKGSRAVQQALAEFYGVKVQRSLIGRCAPCIKQNATKVIVKTLQLDKHVVMYFGRNDVYYAFDPDKRCKDGDIVLIKELKEKKTTLITHELVKIIYPLGDMICPLSGKATVNLSYFDPHYRDDLEKVYEVYGKNDKRFRYDKAPPRGWQENRRDFSHRESYIKYHETEEEQPYAYP